MLDFVSEITVGWLSFTRISCPFGGDLWHCSSDNVTYVESAMLRELAVFKWNGYKVFAR